MTERIQINRQPIERTDFADLFNQVHKRLSKENFLSYFEFITLQAFLYFEEQKVDVAVIETGLGGRLDATNVLEPLLTVITSIAKDHTRHLGSTLPKIAGEKCGIIKQGVPTVIAPQRKSVLNVIQQACAERSSQLFIASAPLTAVPLGLDGEHQQINASVAVEAANVLLKAGFAIKNIEDSLAKTKWAGRLEIVHENPTILLDGAHNVEGAKYLAKHLQTNYSPQETTLVMGAMADKDITGMLSQLSPGVGKIIFVPINSARAANPEDLRFVGGSFLDQVQVAKGEVSEWLPKLISLTPPEEKLVIAGSLVLVGNVRSYLRGHAKKSIH
jgi:dihydrofolate synthase/folylpolyglutamate synthase